MKKADNFDAKQWLVENKITTQSKLIKEGYNELSDVDISDYWAIMVDNQPEDVKKILTDLTTGKLSFDDFITNTSDDVYDSFKDESYYDEDED